MPTADPSQIKDDERRYFEEHLDAYLAQFCRGRWLAYKRFITSCVHPLLPDRPLSILDVGSGPMPAFDRLVPAAARYVCVDFASRPLLHLQAHAPGVRAVRADADALPFPEAAFDLVVVFGLLHHLPDPRPAVEEIRRVLRRGGVIVASEPSTRWEGRMATPHERGLTAGELRALFAGLAVRLWSYDHPALEAWAARIARRVPHWEDAEAPLWPVLFSAERVLDRLGIRGWDFLLLAREGR